MIYHFKIKLNRQNTINVLNYVNIHACVCVVDAKEKILSSLKIQILSNFKIIKSWSNSISLDIFQTHKKICSIYIYIYFFQKQINHTHILWIANEYFNNYYNI